ncbi:P-loop containing nucleoside triphosphate hydrolase protein [Lizonia empirigonia]|nr:P-loop containing nucleoside triphosphate hydrolase protein [Lizonia empirigonia]
MPPAADASLEISQLTTPIADRFLISIVDQLRVGKAETWKSGASFAQVFARDDTNQDIFRAVVTPTISGVLKGETCNVFAYGHTGSGKTHTIIGALMSTSLLNQDIGEKLGIAVRMYEVRGKIAHDLMNGSLECHIREGADGQTHIRGSTEVLDDGRVRIRPIAAKACWSFAQLRQVILSGLSLRKTGASEVHEESSRTHAIFELEIVDQRLLDLRDAVIERESELVPIGKKATGSYIEEQMKCLIKTGDGTFIQNPDCAPDQARIDDAEAEKEKYEKHLKAAENAVADHLKSRRSQSLSGKYVFVDLAGSEYFDRKDGMSAKTRQTPQERQQGQQINSDLFALKEVIRARANGQARIPYRSSPLTMVLRNHFEASSGGQSSMILTVSSEQAQCAATLNTLKHGSLISFAK